mgnify:CR=1 FL=1
MGKGIPNIRSARKQTGGGDSYMWHRSAAEKNLTVGKKLPWESTAKSGNEKRKQWHAEVKAIVASRGITYKEALKVASAQRKEKIPGYKTVRERVIGSYVPRVASNVKCSGSVCPGRYNKSAGKTYRPNAHKGPKRHLTVESASHVLREHYRKKAISAAPDSIPSTDETARVIKKSLARHTSAMRHDISKKRKGTPQSPCPTKTITYMRKGKQVTRRVIDKSAPTYKDCRSNWLYRNDPSKLDMVGVDHGTGKDSPAYGRKRLSKVRKV